MYKNLYTAAPCNGSNYKLFFENSNIARLEVTQLEELERPLLYEECFLILKCSKNTSPGTGGLSVEFYLRFWSLLGEEMRQSLNYACKHGQTEHNAKTGYYQSDTKKKKRHSLKTENWRPISLLNADYKIATKAEAHRISKLLPTIAKEDQTGYVSQI